MNLTTIESDILTKLETDISGVAVKAFPDNPQEYNLTHPGGALLLRYNGSDYEEPDPNNQKFLTQTRLFRWVITIMQRSLKFKNGHRGIYDLIESVRSTLSGYTITGLPDASIMYPIGDRFITENQGLWIYAIEFVLSHPETE